MNAVPRYLLYVGLWLLLSSVFASQLYLAGHVTPWSRAFAAEAVYWLSWWMLLPAVFWLCRRLLTYPIVVRVFALFIGAVLAALVEHTLYHVLMGFVVLAGTCPAECAPPGALFGSAWLQQAVRVAGVNLPVYAGIVLAWHAGTFHRESRDRQMKAVELESMLRQAQIEALRSQLNPHFLFNALHSMAELVHTDPKLAEQLIVKLGELLRQVLQSSSRVELSLGEELDFIRAYVEIEQMRLGDRLVVDWQIEPRALDSRVPSLILQPLVENAIQHGIAPNAEPGKLTIRAWRKDGHLTLEVHDTGRGPHASSTERPRGVGLINTRARLERLYRAGYAFELVNDEGFTARLRIPATAA